jgi:hypothetical protein
VKRQDLYLGAGEDGRLIAVVGADGKRLEGVVEARPLMQELVFRLGGNRGTQVRKMPFTLVHAVTGEVIDDRGAAR